jgi:hypothetical protein
VAGVDVDHLPPVGRRVGARGHRVTQSRSSWFMKWRDAAIQ